MPPSGALEMELWRAASATWPRFALPDALKSASTKFLHFCHQVLARWRGDICQVSRAEASVLCGVHVREQSKGMMLL